jgi:hypothetical protein
MDAKNDEAREQLIETLRSKGPILVTGSGVSTYCGYRRWGAVIDRFAEFVEACSPGCDAKKIVKDNSTDLMIAATALTELAGDRVREFMAAEFGPNGVRLPDLVIKLCAMPFAHYLTFNYDTSLERILQTLHQPYEVTTTADFSPLIEFLRSRNPQRRVVYLHGRYTDPPQTLAWAQAGYRRRYAEDGPFRRFLWWSFMTQSLFFAGVGFREFELNFQWWNFAGDMPKNVFPHFAIVGLWPNENAASIRNVWNKRYCVEPLFYPIDDSKGYEDHSEFEKLIFSIWNQLQLPQPAMVDTRPVNALIVAADPGSLKVLDQLSRKFREKNKPRSSM